MRPASNVGESTSARRPRGLRWLTGVPVVTLVLAAIVAGVAWWSPAARHQLSESFTRHPRPFVELALLDGSTADVQDACTAGAPEVPVSFTLTARGGDGARTVRYSAAVVPDPAGSPTTGATPIPTPTPSPSPTTSSATPARVGGSVRLSPGHERTVRASVPTTVRPWTLVVHLTGTQQTLSVHCEAPQ